MIKPSYEHELNVFLMEGLGFTREKTETGRRVWISPDGNSTYRETWNLSGNEDSNIELLAELLNQRDIYINRVGQDWDGLWHAVLILPLAKSDPRREDFYGSWSYEAEAYTPNMALSLALKKLIVGEKKYEQRHNES